MEKKFAMNEKLPEMTKMLMGMVVGIEDLFRNLFDVVYAREDGEKKNKPLENSI